jgi:CubicO group peptidase (beta-lactamase class C family)
MRYFLPLLFLVTIWNPASGQVGPSTDEIDAILERAQAMDPLNSLLIWHRDSLVVEQYYRGMRANRAVNLKSASKSILSALVGIALENGQIDSLSQPLQSLLPEYFGESTDPRKRTITLQHALTMRTGLETTSFGSYGAWVSSGDWVRFQLDQPVECAPATCWGYSTGSSHLVSAILTRRTGQSTLAFARTALFDKLGIHLRAWDRDPQGIYLGGNNMSLRPRDLLRFGRLYLNGGLWNGEQILSRAWIDASWGRYARSPWNGNGYGYFWWNRSLSDEETYFAWGYGGQFLFVIPRLELVVVVTASLTNRPPGSRRHNQRVYELLRREIIPPFRRIHPIGPTAR